MAELSGEIPENLERRLEDIFMWVNSLDLTQEIYFYSKGLCYRGFADAVCQEINNYGIPCRVELPEIKRKFDWKFNWEFRPLQEEAVDAWLGNQNGILQASPGFGKTVCASAAICKAGVRSVVLVQNKEPFTQAYNTLCASTSIDDVGMFGCGKKKLGEVTVVMIQALSRELKNNPQGEVAKWWRSVELIIVDEAHHAASDSYIEILSQLDSIQYLLGTSATPMREDGRSHFLTSYCGPIIFDAQYGVLIDHDILCPVTVYVVNGPPVDTRLAETVKEVIEDELDSTYMELYDSYVVNNTARSELIVEFARECIENNISVAVIVSRIEHARNLQQLYPELVVVTSEQNDRLEIFDKLKRKEIMGVISTLLDEAVDIPSLGAVALAAGGKSYIKLFQRLRSLRTFEGETAKGYFKKDRGYVLYVKDRAPTLNSHSDRCIKYLQGLVEQHPENDLVYLA